MGGDVSTPVKRLGDWLARVTNTVYLAATDGFVVGYSVGTPITALTDSANPPTIMRDGDNSASNVNGISVPVRKGDYWKVTGTTTVWWIPLEPG